MSVQLYAGATSVAQGGSLDLHVNDASGTGVEATAVITEFGSGREVLRSLIHADAHPTPDDPAADRQWPVGFTVDVPNAWPSGLYVVEASPGQPAEHRAFFAVRAADPGDQARILVSIPFPTWDAYAWAGEPGASPYWNEQPDRGGRVSLRRPSPERPRWETPVLRWLAGSGYAVEYCSAYDLDAGGELLAAYQLLLSIGHDEYWSSGMRDTAEGFLATGGNIAFLTGNTCWWQFRREDDGATFVCYRDATEDPLTGAENRLVTVEWSSAPVNRPENHLTGVSFRRGAGCWRDTDAMAGRSWTARFADHWVFEGTGLADGDAFGTGTVGYETDAAEVCQEGGAVRVTARDGTPSHFVVLATTDLADWRTAGQGGAATMGTFRTPGGGTVFTASTTGWGNGLAGGDPVVERITRNVLDRLCERWPAGNWERIGDAHGLTAMVACENRLFAAGQDNALRVRDPVGQNLTWVRIGQAHDVRALAAPREAMAGEPIGLYAVTADGALWSRDPILDDAAWTPRCPAPGQVALAACYQNLFAATTANDLVYLPFGRIDSTPVWTRIGHADDVVAMTNLNGKLFCVTGDRWLWMRKPVLHEADWTPIGEVPGRPVALAGYAGKLFLATADDRLYWRDAVG